MARGDSGLGAALRSAPQPAHRVGYTVLRTSIFDEVFTYGIGVTWRTYIAHLGRTAGNNGGWCGRGSSASMVAGSGAPPAKLRAPTWASASGETPRAVNLAPKSG
jgi:hypothetical protein